MERRKPSSSSSTTATSQPSSFISSYDQSADSDFKATHPNHTHPNDNDTSPSPQKKKRKSVHVIQYRWSTITEFWSRQRKLYDWMNQVLFFINGIKHITSSTSTRICGNKKTQTQKTRSSPNSTHSYTRSLLCGIIPISTQKRARQNLKQKYSTPLLVIFLLIVVSGTSLFILWMTHLYQHQIRFIPHNVDSFYQSYISQWIQSYRFSSTEHQQKMIPILIPHRKEQNYKYKQRIFRPHAHPINTAPNYGGLKLVFLPAEQPHRRIHLSSYNMDHQTHDWKAHVYSKQDFGKGQGSNEKHDDSVNPYYAYDDDMIRSTITFPYGKVNTCRRTAWHRLNFQTCMIVHETELLSSSPRNRFISHGSYRDVFVMEDSLQIQTILKTNRYKHSFTYDIYEFIRMDALVMERLTSSPRVANIYGHCGTSVFTEHLPGEFEASIVPGSGYIDAKDLNDTEDVQPQNDFSPTQKLQWALSMAESIADLHGFKDGVIVHDDIQLAQYLFKPDMQTLKLNDFNRAEIMLYDEVHGNYCRYYNGPGGGNWRAPEEYIDGPIDESIDVWSYGNNVYSLLTGLWVFYDTEDDKVMKTRITNGTQAFIDPRYRNHSFAEGKIVDVIERIWKYRPEDRPSIFDIVRFLREALTENNKRRNSTSE